MPKRFKYDHVISLGGNCEVAYHWRRFSGEETAYPFDWWIVPFESVQELLADAMREVYMPHNMQLIYQRTSVLCRRYGIALHHDFDRNPDTTIFTGTMEECCLRARERTQFLYQRLVDVCHSGRKVLFVRSWRETLYIHEYDHDPDDVRRYDFNRFIDGIKQLFPALECDFLFVNYGEQKVERAGAFFHNIQDKGDRTGWEGSPGGWDEMFNIYTLL